MSTQAEIPTARAPWPIIGLGLLGLGAGAVLTVQLVLTDVRYDWYRVVEMRRAETMFGTTRTAIVQKDGRPIAVRATNMLTWIDAGTYICTSETRSKLRSPAKYRVELSTRCASAPKPMPPLSVGRPE
tara:strand:- start:118 stop:501 length:384 start_codon:yes stop_codon:yes gene_type:complete